MAMTGMLKLQTMQGNRYVPEKRKNTEHEVQQVSNSRSTLQLIFKERNKISCIWQSVAVALSDLKSSWHGSTHTFGGMKKTS